MGCRVLLADDHTLFRQGLRALLEREGFEVVGEAGDGSEAVRFARELRPDVAVLDLAMPRLNGMDAARELRAALPLMRTVLLTVHNDQQYVVAALNAGVKGYVLKTQASTDLVEAIRSAMKGDRYLSPGLSTGVAEAIARDGGAAPDPLTMREREVLQLVAEGKSSRVIGQILKISPKTAEAHRTRIMKKLGIHETAGLVRYAIRNGLIEA
jgi:two-component system, NarL family, response regulator NreC